MAGITPRRRMLAAYRGEPTDRAPVAPEFWYYIPARLLGLNMIEFAELPHWQALQKTFRHYECEGWGLVAPHDRSGQPFDVRTTTLRLEGGRLEHRSRLKLPDRELTWASIADPDEPSWATERMIKDLDWDWPIYEQMTMVEPTRWDWAPVQQALDAVGEDYLLEVYLGVPFLDYVAGQRQGGIAQAMLDVLDRESLFLDVRARYIDRLCRMIREAFSQTTAESAFLCCCWSCVSLVGPRLFRQWEYPVIEAAARAAHDCGKLLHLHLHGRCMDVAADLPELGPDCVCPFERAPGGDVSDLAAVRVALADRVTMNGNVHTVEALIRGAPDDVRAQVREVLDAFQGSRRVIVGTGDQVGRETPDANIHAMIDCAKTYVA